ncbi:NADH dehydrogenase [Novipirellula aureliae]|uniref:NADH dehydrogenase n=1 Tax=Novipirellula aureliae TaxID=2527966 RepID=A0A5C6E6A6_9BACT|nr:nitroreductase family protein [Novipirellula aureliae]TWU44368.1 NADH dehydrogenase [Novipirellula aureliae]
MPEYKPIEYTPPSFSGSEMRQRARAFYEHMSQRRSVRDFSDDNVPQELIELAIAAASTSPSGANRQPWHFVAISNPTTKRQIRVAAEAEERESYLGGRMSPEWIDALAPLGTDWQKPFLEVAPWLVVIFEESYGIDTDGSRRKNYYVKESVGMACGFFIAALHNMGLAALTHTPSPMGFLSDILGRPENEKPYVLIPIGYPASNCLVPDVQRKPLADVAEWV